MIGLGAISGAALLRGARVIAVDVDDAKLALARKAGAAETNARATKALRIFFMGFSISLESVRTSCRGSASEGGPRALAGGVPGRGAA